MLNLMFINPRSLLKLITYINVSINTAAAAAAKSLQSCPTLCDPIDGSPPGSPVPGILQARILEWVAIPFSRGSSQPRNQTQVSSIPGGFFSHIGHFRVLSRISCATHQVLVGYLFYVLLLSHFSRVRSCATPQTAAHQAPPSLGFSRQEHWSGLPCPSPMHESGK